MASDSAARLRAAQGYAELGMLEAAWRELRSIGEAGQRRLDPEALQTETLLLIKEKRWEEGLACSQHLRTLMPDSAAGFIHGAFCLHELGRTKAAHDLLESGPKSLRRQAVYHYNIACYRAVMGKRKSALKALVKAFDIDPSFRRAAKSDPDLELLRKDAGFA